MDPLSAPSKTVPSAVPSTSTDKLVIDKPVGKRVALFVWSATPPSPTILPLPKVTIFDSGAKHLLTRLSTLVFCNRIKFANAHAKRTPTCVLALKGGREGVLGGRGRVIKVCRLIVK